MRFKKVGNIYRTFVNDAYQQFLNQNKSTLSLFDTSRATDSGKPSSQPAGYLMNKFGLILLLAILLVAVWFGQVMVAILLGLVLSAAGLARLWSRFSLVGVYCQRVLSGERCFPGEYLEMRLRLVNRKLLPLPWLKLSDEVPVGFIQNASLEPGTRPGYGVLSYFTSLKWYSALNWRYQLYCAKRGYYPLGPTTTTSGDIFGIYSRSITQPATDHIIVYPKILPLSELGIVPWYLLGDTKAEQRLFEDPTRPIGTRDLSPQDSLRHIHWKASARQQRLQVKVFEPTTTLKVAVFLAVESFQTEGVLDEDSFELGISTAASVANYCIARGSPVGLYVNSWLADLTQMVRIPPASTVGQLVSILEALAKLTYRTGDSFERFIEGERRGLSWGTTVVLVLSDPTEALSRLLARLGSSGYRVLVLQVGGAGESPVPGVRWHRVRDLSDKSQVGYGGEK